MADARATRRRWRIEVPAQPRPAARPPGIRVPAPLFAFGFAAALTVGISAAVLAAPPGSPLYNARLYIETATMPVVGDFDGRLTAYESRLERRIDEAEAAEQRGDRPGLVAALAAYQAEVTAAVAEVGEEPHRLARLQGMLSNHVVELEALAARLTSDGAGGNAVNPTITVSRKAAEKLRERAAHGNSAGNGHGNGGANGHGNGNGNAHD